MKYINYLSSKSKNIIILLVISEFTFAQISKISNRDWSLDTKSMTYQIGINENKLYAYYYGPKINNTNQSSISSKWTHALEVPVRGGNANNPVLEAVFNDNVRDIDLIYVKDDIIQQNGYQVLKITQQDTYYPLQVCSYYRVLPEYDIIEKWIEVSNTGGKKNILIENLQSGSLWLPASWYKLTHLSGSLGNEFQPQTTLLTQGIKTIQSRDFKSYGSSYFAIRKKNENNEYYGDVWYGQLQYSGVWSMNFERLPNGTLEIVGGIRFWDSWINLKPKESFTSPKLCYGYTNKGISDVSRIFSNYTRKILSPVAHRDSIRPIIYNSWYATGFNVNEQQQLSLAQIAKSIGVEMYVIDDGWFKGRTNDQGGLGDWIIDKNKFPNGLSHLIKKINDMGMNFGIWIEPEMVNPNSDLYRKHPEWIFYFPNRIKTLSRNQLMLNLAREDVYQYLYTSISSLLRNNNIKYLKWDMNRQLTEPGWPSVNSITQREVRIRYIKNLYRLIDRLKNEFPNVWFESCSSGGGRVDLGILSRMDVAWASDNIDPLDRIFIQYGYLNAYPANTMISWTGQESWHKINYTLDFRFDVAMSGILGIGNDISKWNPEEIKLAKEKISLYKEIRPIVQNGILYQLSSPYNSKSSTLEYIKEDSTEAVVFCYNINEKIENSERCPIEDIRLKIKGLNPKKTYIIEGDKRLFSGSYLMDVGILYPVKGIFRSKIMRIKEI
jgi:alpha-galactosidase